MRGVMDRQVTEGCRNEPSSVRLEMKCPIIWVRDEDCEMLTQGQ